MLNQLFEIRKKIDEGEKPDSFFDLAVANIASTDNDCRWQSLIVLGEFLDAKPEEIWKIILEYGSSDDEDMRTAIATVLLEHYFEHHPDSFEEKFPVIKERIQDGDTNLKFTLRMCRFHFGNKKRDREVKALLKN